MLLALDEATIKTIGLLATFVGIGIIVNVILIYVAVQVRGRAPPEPGIPELPPRPRRLLSLLRRRGGAQMM